MKKHIRYFWHVGGIKEVDTESGSVVDIPTANEVDAQPGSVWKQNGKWFAFYKDDESWLLQHKNSKWRVTPEHSVSLRAWFLLRNFRIKRGGRLVFSIWYRPKYLFFFLIDPTYDAIDAETDDFFLFVKNTWNTEDRHPDTEMGKCS
jgi:hypothetical protein